MKQGCGDSSSKHSRPALLCGGMRFRHRRKTLGLKQVPAVLQVRLAALKREEDGLQREKERLEAEKERHFRFLPFPYTTASRRALRSGILESPEPYTKPCPPLQ